VNRTQFSRTFLHSVPAIVLEELLIQGTQLIVPHRGQSIGQVVGHDERERGFDLGHVGEARAVEGRSKVG